MTNQERHGLFFLFLRSSLVLLMFTLSVSCNSGSAQYPLDEEPLPDEGCYDNLVIPDTPLNMDCREDQVDSFWGEAPSPEKRQLIFDAIWAQAAREFPGFATVSEDWDEVGEQGRTALENASGYGRYFQILNDMVLTLGDGHSGAISKRIAGWGKDGNPMTGARPASCSNQRCFLSQNDRPFSGSKTG